MGIVLIVVAYLLVCLIAYIVVLLVHVLASIGVALFAVVVVLGVAALFIWLWNRTVPLDARSTVKADFERELIEIHRQAAATQSLMEQAAREAKTHMDSAMRGTL